MRPEGARDGRGVRLTEQQEQGRGPRSEGRLDVRDERLVDGAPEVVAEERAGRGAAADR